MEFADAANCLSRISLTWVLISSFTQLGREQGINLKGFFRCRDLNKLCFIEALHDTVIISSCPRVCEAMLRRSPHDDAEVHNGALRRSQCGSVLALITTIRGNPLASSWMAATISALRLGSQLKVKL